MILHRRRASLLATLCLLTVSAFAAAQLTITVNPEGPDYMTPDAPFTLVRTTRVQTRTQNGSYLSHEEREHITRDSKGRVFDLLTPVLDDQLSHPVTSYVLGDPVTHLVTEWASNRNTALQNTLPTGGHLQLIALNQSTIEVKKLPSTVTRTTEDLGTQEIAGIAATGTRTTLLIPANLVGNTTPLRYVTEVWISPALGIPLR